MERSGSKVTKSQSRGARIGCAASQESERDGRAVLLLAILPAFADRILAGKKKFELRKRIPREPFSRVYLYASGGQGVVGAFDVKNIITLPVPELWEAVGEEATTKERFYGYFGDFSQGSAIEVSNPVRFLKPLQSPELRQYWKKFNAPQSFSYIRPGTRLYDVLEQKRRESQKPTKVKLRPIRDAEHKRYIKLVTDEIRPRYDEISSDFAKQIIATHKARIDRKGIFTTKKQVLSVEALDGRLLGFTTLTFKIGHSVKTGPSVFFEEYRRQGFGPALRIAIDEFARRKGIKKLYCTIPDNEPELLKHFIRADYRIEAHLAAHYQLHRGEIVLGKVLEHSPGLQERISRKISVAGRTGPITADDSEAVANFLRSSLHRWFPLPAKRSEKIVKAALRGQQGAAIEAYETKPLEIWQARSQRGVSAILILVHKRGGSTKAMLVSDTAHTPTLRRLIRKAERDLKKRSRRKICFLHPIRDPAVQELLVSLGYRIEGTLQEPYSPGQDLFVLSKFL